MPEDRNLPNRFNFKTDPAYLGQLRRDAAETNRQFDRNRAVLPGYPDDQRLDRELLGKKSAS